MFVLTVGQGAPDIPHSPQLYGKGSERMRRHGADVAGTQVGGSGDECDSDAGPQVPLAQSNPQEYWRRVWKLYASSGAIILGNVLEWYDWTVFGYMEGILKDIFMDGSDVHTWLMFAVPFIARPAGSIILGWVADRFGRKVALNAAIWGMALSTTLQGCLVPGWRGTSYMLGLLRIIAGISAGGESAGVNTYMTEIGGPERDHTLGAAVGVNNLSGALAFFLANAVAFCVNLAPREAQISWAWRVPFLLAAPIGIASVVLRHSMKETDAFMSLQAARAAADAAEDDADKAGNPELDCSSNRDIMRTSPSGLVRTISLSRDAEEDDEEHSKTSTETSTETSEEFDPLESDWCADARAVLLIFIVNGAMVSCNYLPLYLTRWLETSVGLTSATALSLAALSKVVQMVMTPLVAFATDSRGQTATMIVGGLATSLVILPFFFVLLRAAHARDPGAGELAETPTLAVCVVAFLQLGVVLPAFMSFYMISSPLFATSLFPAHRRGLGAGVGMGLASVLGGLTPLIASALARRGAWLPGALVVALVLPSVAALAWFRMAAKRKQLRVHQRPWLY